MSIFGTPNIDRLKKKGDVKGLHRVLVSSGSSNELVVDAALALLDLNATDVLREALHHELGSNWIRQISQAFIAHKNKNACPVLYDLWLNYRNTDTHLQDSVRQQVRSEIRKMPRAWLDAGSIAALVGILRDETSDLRVSAAIDLEGVRNAEVVAALVDCLRAPDLALRTQAASALKGIDDPGVKAALFAAHLASLQVKYQPARIEAIRALGASESAGAVEPLAALLTDPDALIQSEAAHALAALGDRRGLDILMTEIGGQNEAGRVRAVASLGRLGTDMIPTLVKLLCDPSREVKQAAARSLALLGWAPTMDEAGAFYFLATGEVKGCLRVGAKSTLPLFELISELEQHCNQNLSIRLVASIRWGQSLNWLTVFNVAADVADQRLLPVLLRLVEKENAAIAVQRSSGRAADDFYLEPLKTAIARIRQRGGPAASPSWIELMELAALPLGRELVLAQRLTVMVSCPSCGNTLAAGDAYRPSASFLVCPRCGDDWLVRFLSGQYQRNAVAHPSG